jgi:hypothetical protein
MPRLSQQLKLILLTTVLVLWSGASAHAQIATNITGLYYTGMNASGGLLTQSSNTGKNNSGTTDPNWSVTYVAGTTTATGAAYVLNSNAISGYGYVANTSTAQWITAPGAKDPNNGNRTNSGGSFLPGTASSPATYVYTLAFTIAGSGAAGTTVTNGISINLTIAADDNASIYVNPSGNGTTLPTGTAAFAVNSAWGNTSSATLQNGTDHTGTSGNSVFKIGTNYLTIVVTNAGGTNPNASGLLVYQVGTAMTIDGNPVQGVIPEVGTWIPLAAALGLFGWTFWRRRTSAASVAECTLD